MMQVNEYIARKWFQASKEIIEKEEGGSVGEYDDPGTEQTNAQGVRIIDRIIELIPELADIDMNRNIERQIHD